MRVDGTGPRRLLSNVPLGGPCHLLSQLTYELGPGLAGLSHGDKELGKIAENLGEPQQKVEEDG